MKSSVYLPKSDGIFSTNHRQPHVVPLRWEVYDNTTCVIPHVRNCSNLVACFVFHFIMIKIYRKTCFSIINILNDGGTMFCLICITPSRSLIIRTSDISCLIAMSTVTWIVSWLGHIGRTPGPYSDNKYDVRLFNLDFDPENLQWIFYKVRCFNEYTSHVGLM